MARPAIATARMPGIDVARALAVLGMVLVNYRLKMGVMEEGPDWMVWAMYRLDGRAAALFVMLAGVGISLRSRRARSDPEKFAARERNALLWRAAILFALGLLNLHMWSWDILHFYGVYLAFAAFMLRAPSFVLWGLSAVVTVVSVWLRLQLDYGWHPDFWGWEGFLSGVFFNGIHPVFPWLAFLLIGMWLGRQDLRDSGVRIRLMAVCVPLWLGGELIDQLSWYKSPEIGLSEDAWQWLSSWPRPPGPVFVVSATAAAMAAIAACIQVTESRPNAMWVTALAATGQLAFTLYIAHAVAILVPLQHDWLDDYLMPGALLYGLAFYAVAIAGSLWWRRRYPHGPLEGLIRQVTGRTTPAPWGGQLIEASKSSDAS